MYYIRHLLPLFFFFFFSDPAPTEIYTLSLHDALPISRGRDDLEPHAGGRPHGRTRGRSSGTARRGDRKSTRLNSSHRCISYAVFCLKKKKKKDARTELVIDNEHTKHTSVRSRFRPRVH